MRPSRSASRPLLEVVTEADEGGDVKPQSSFGKTAQRVCDDRAALYIRCSTHERLSCIQLYLAHSMMSGLHL